MADGYQTLTEKEKETLRLIVQGHDAKSLARHLGLSVHTVNERLRHARRKMAASSSREAARQLRESEGENCKWPGDPTPQLLVPIEMGAESASASMPPDAAPADGTAAGRVPPQRPVRIVAGVIVMSLVLAVVALVSLATPAGAPDAAGDGSVAASAQSTEIARSAQDWLALVDAAKWDESWRATARSFRKANTPQLWARVSREVRVPLGAVQSRRLASQDSVPTPPRGNEIVKFRTSFAGKPDATETLALVREGAGWKVVGYYIE